MSEYGDLAAAALHADAEAARAEIRAAGISCPSCGLNMADLLDGHALALYDVPGETAPGAECALGSPALLAASFELMQAAASIALYDDFRRWFDAAVRRDIIGTGELHGAARPSRREGAGSRGLTPPACRCVPRPPG